MRFPVGLVAVLVCGACFSYGRQRVVSTGVPATRSIEDLRKCATEQLSLLGYIVAPPVEEAPPGAVQAVRPWALNTEQPRFAGYVDRIDLLARNTTDRASVPPQTELSATARTLNGERRNQAPSEQVQADASRVLTTCAPQ